MLSTVRTLPYTTPARALIPRGIVGSLISMSTGDDKSRESSPAKSPTRGRSRDSSARPRPPRAQVIEFIDSQDPNVKSAIQRHTAYHSAAQRREARIQSLRRGRQSRFLEWGRRQGAESAPAISPSSSSSPSQHTTTLQAADPDISPGSTRTSSATGLPVSEAQTLSRLTSRESASITTTLTPAEETLLQFLRFYIRAQHNLVPSNRDSITHLRDLPVDTPFPHQPESTILDTTIAYIRLDEACTHLLVAYAYSLRARLQETSSATEQDNRTARRYLASATSLLRNRLGDSATASSDANIQVVLLLLSYTADFGSASEVEIHTDALRTMVQQRGGLESLSASGNTVLRRQLVAADDARKYHLTLICQDDCCREVRFPGGFWTRPQQ